MIELGTMCTYSAAVHIVVINVILYCRTGFNIYIYIDKWNSMLATYTIQGLKHKDTPT